MISNNPIYDKPTTDAWQPDTRKPKPKFKEVPEERQSYVDYVVIVGRWNKETDSSDTDLQQKHYGTWEEFMGAINYYTQHSSKKHNYYVRRVNSGQEKRNLKGQVYMCKARFKNKIKDMTAVQIYNFMFKNREAFVLPVHQKEMTIRYIEDIIIKEAS